MINDIVHAPCRSRLATPRHWPARPAKRGDADAAIACTPVRLCRIPRNLVDELAQGPGNLPREAVLCLLPGRRARLDSVLLQQPLRSQDAL